MKPYKKSGTPDFLYGGEEEIRTPGELPHACFQDKYLKPLGHLSASMFTQNSRFRLTIESCHSSVTSPFNSSNSKLGLMNWFKATTATN